jgi:DNA-binding transcriptional LysR family regulator
MTLEQLRVFVAVAERLHVTRAAEALAMTQSAASGAVQALETRLDIKLFNRVGRHIELTDAGRLFLPEARAVLRRVAEAEDVLDDLLNLRRGSLALAASQTVGSYWLPTYLHRFATAYPNVALSLAIGNTHEVAEAVIDGSAELGFVEGEVEAPLLARSEVGTDTMTLVVGAGHPWAGRTDLTNDELMRGRWVLREHGSGTRQVLETELRQRGLDPAALNVALTLPSNEAICAAVGAGAGATVTSRLIADAELAAGRLTAVPFAISPRRFLALRHADRHRSRATAALMALIRSP